MKDQGRYVRPRAKQDDKHDLDVLREQEKARIDARMRARDQVGFTLRCTELGNLFLGNRPIKSTDTGRNFWLSFNMPVKILDVKDRLERAFADLGGP
jgi:hypothetical protein